MFVCNYEDGRVIFLVDYNNRDRAKALGAFWDTEKKVWFKDLSKMLSDHGGLTSMVRELHSAGFELSPSAEINVKKAIDELERAEEILEQKKRDYSAPQPEGMSVELFPFQKAGVAFLEPLKTAILADDMGCLSGDTIIRISRGGNIRKYRLEDIFIKFNNKSNNQRYNWDKKIPTYCRSLCDGILKHHRINQVLFRGIKEVFEIELESGKKIKTTIDHEFLSDSNDWIECRKLKSGSTVMTNGTEIIFTPKKDKVKKIRKCGFEKVYDIVMDDPYRNFVANGIIVHNCGKTIQSIGWARKKLPVLVVCPASVKENWKREILKSLPNSVVGIVKQKKLFYHGKTDLDGKSIDSFISFCLCPDWLIINYDMLGEWLAWLAEQNFKSMIVDESHAIKNAKAQRTNNCLILSETIENRLCVTGTPLLNRPTELFTLLQFIGKVKKKDFFWWRKRYCELEEKTIPVFEALTDEQKTLVDAGEKIKRQFKRDENGKVITRKNVKVVGAKNSKELRTEMLPYFLRRLKSEVLTDLPDKTFSDMFVELTNREEYDAAEEDIIGYIAKSQGWEKASIAERAKFLAKLSRLRQLSVAGKLSAVRGILDDVRECDGKKAVIFSNFVDVLKKLKAELGDEAVIYVGDDANQSAIDEFQTNPDVRFFLTTIKKGGVGITLTQSDTVIFIDLPWTPGEKAQAEDRCHRIGQKNNVTVIHVIGDDTVDCLVLEALATKEGIIKKIVDGKDDEQIAAEGNTMKIVEKMMRNKFKIS